MKHTVAHTQGEFRVTGRVFRLNGCNRFDPEVERLPRAKNKILSREFQTIPWSVPRPSARYWPSRTTVHRFFLVGLTRLNISPPPSRLENRAGCRREYSNNWFYWMIALRL